MLFRSASTTFTVSLAFQPASPVNVLISSSNNGIATVSPTFLLFTPANYAIPQTVTVNGVPDANLTNDSTSLVLELNLAANLLIPVTVTDAGP